MFKILEHSKQSRDSRYFISSFLLLLFSFTVNNTYATTHSKEHLLAVYIFKLAEHIQWPNSSQKDFYHLHLIDKDSQTEDQLRIISQIRKLHGKELRITRSTGDNIPNSVELIFVAKNAIEKYSQVFPVTQNTNTLLISNDLNNDRIALIDLREASGNKISFKINKANILNRNLSLNPDIILLGGTEIDVAQLYKEGLQNLQAQDQLLQVLKQNIASQQAKDTQLKADLTRTKNEESRLSRQLSDAEEKINQQNSEIAKLQKKIEKEQAELEILRLNTQKIQAMLIQKNKAIHDSEVRYGQLKLDIEEKTRILDEKKQKILLATNQLEKQEAIIHYQQRFLFLLMVIGLLTVLLLIITFIGYRNKRLSNQLLEKNAVELAQAKKIAEHHASVKSAFLSNMSHELRNPLTAIIGFSHLIYKNPITPQNIKEHSNIITRSANHLLGLINDVLEMSKIESGKIELYEEDIDFRGMINDVGNMSKILAEEKNLNLILDLSPTCPHFIRVDAGKLRRIFINLINNAIKYTKEGEISVCIKCEPSENQKINLLCEIKDSGIGISAENFEKIFRPFEQIPKDNQRKNSMPGTGLGLSISKELIEYMHGSISVESKQGFGSTFRFNVIVSSSPHEATSLQCRTEKIFLGIKPDQKRVKALIVEDISDNRIYLENTLNNLHCEVVSTGNGEEAIEAIKTHQFDIIFMDIRMPVMDGIEATELIRQLPMGKNIKIIAITASAFKEEQEKIMPHGFDDFIKKPYLPEEIRDCLAKHLQLEFIYQSDFTDLESWEDSNKKVKVDIKVELKKLTLNERLDLESAVLTLDVEKTMSLIDAIKIQHPELADSLRVLVENYDFTHLQSIIKNIKTI
ncbi:signal transduction histidine kinase [Nitrosomonas sp. Nm84]|uniref:YfiR/HmsC family protein n=1 Tax=Nitrosomonas sp. Nm84 TaxID=200124 RepID=UPI000D753669|nr:YfiR/HmsC family protein [Nitrosomonas sp. Nm84]PXW89638.1 signal transduction histidine kinase [Nitrosomonas sp. Nm84]